MVVLTRIVVVLYSTIYITTSATGYWRVASNRIRRVNIIIAPTLDDLYGYNIASAHLRLVAIECQACNA